MGRWKAEELAPMMARIRNELLEAYGAAWQEMHGIMPGNHSRGFEYRCAHCESDLPDLYRVQEHIRGKLHRRRVGRTLATAPASTSSFY